MDIAYRLGYLLTSGVPAKILDNIDQLRCRRDRHIDMTLPTILLLHSSTDGHTIAICRFISEQLEQAGCASRLLAIDEVTERDIQQCDKIVVGARVRHGKHAKAVYHFVDQYLPFIETRPNAFFSVSLVARKSDKDRLETNPYAQKFLDAVAWKPGLADVFAGKFAFERYGLGARLLLGLVFRVSEGKPAPKETVEYTNWNRVQAFSQSLIDLR